MSGKPISMRKIKEILRLKYENGLSKRKIALACNVGDTTVIDYLARLRTAQLTWADVRDVGDDELERRLFPVAAAADDRRGNALPDWGKVHLERRRDGVTLQVLWEEYLEGQPDGLQYSQFCERYRQYARIVDVRMRQIHVAGEKMFVDYAGKKMEVIDQRTGVIREASIFVAVMGASNYTFAQATWTQGLSDWVHAHVAAFDFFDGVPRAVVPDNLKSGVRRACYYDPDINPTYAELAKHYGVAVLPARARKPRDKAKVEAGVQFVQRWLLARLRHQRFHTLAELNEAIGVWLKRLNERPFRKLPGSRVAVFETIEKPALKPLPTQRYEYAVWKDATVNIDYHIDLDGHYYSVPYRLASQRVTARQTATTVEIFHRHDRVASHARDDRKGQHSTLDEHLPPQHAAVKFTPSRFLEWAAKIGSATCQVVEHILRQRQHPEQGYRSCLGVLRFAEKVGRERLEAACRRALAFGAPRYRTVRAILENGQDRLPLPQSATQLQLPEHENIRGPEFFGGAADAVPTDA